MGSILYLPMAKPEASVIQVLRKAAALLLHSRDYQWGHMGRCNCGFLAQAATEQSPAEIHTAAMAGHGDWSEQLNDYCPTSGYAMDGLIRNLLLTGFEREDLAHLERLSDPQVLSRLQEGRRLLQYNQKDDVVHYLHAWANLLEEQWAAAQPTPSILMTDYDVAN